MFLLSDLHPFRVVLPVLAFEDHRARLQAAQRVPLALGDMDSGNISAGDELVTGSLLSVIVKEHLLGHTAQHNHILAGVGVPVDWDHRPGLNGVEHPLAGVVLAVAQVVVLAKAGIHLRLLC